MNMTNIQATLKWAELPANHEDGIFLQPEEAGTIDTALGSVASLTADLKTANDTVATHVATIQTMTAAATASKDASDAKDAKILELEGKVTALGKEPSGTGGTKLNTKEDDKPEEKAVGKLPRFDSADHPANKAAARFVKPADGK